MPTTASPLQIDAHGLSSAIYHLHGATKIWLTIPSGQKLNFESLVETKMPDLLKPSVLSLIGWSKLEIPLIGRTDLSNDSS
ncbi:unnamed protein product [Allacma fusca]|uniref:JmjC domain-containing protein n=1 Tax=Allacma fusca TaxID=39272 RepID=A0A8J2LFV6_9HEXA|nr:unnamed protein product [Allacma fusca]